MIYMAEKPILFRTPMVRAILDGRQTQTRRVVERKGYELELQEPWRDSAKYEYENLWQIGQETGKMRHTKSIGVCSRYQLGDILWVRETCNRGEARNGDKKYIYKADIEPLLQDIHTWHPSIHMPRTAARIFLRVTDVRVERVQEISTDNALAEGIRERILQPRAYELNGGKKIYEYADDSGTTYSAVEAYEKLWDSLNAKRGYGWDSNPWVWVYSFEKVV